MRSAFIYPKSIQRGLLHAQAWCARSHLQKAFLNKEIFMIMKRLWIALVAIPVCLISVLVIGAQRPYPATAAGVIDPTCISSLPCIEYDNNGTGPAIRGIALNGNGVAGATHINSTSATNARAGVLGKDDSTSGTFNSGVSGQSVRGTGVSGVSTSGKGISGSSSSGPGLSGTSTSGDGVDGSGNTGVLGSGSNIGVLGSSSNTGVQGNSSGEFATGVQGNSSGKFGTGVQGNGTGTFGVGVSGTGGSIGVVGINTSAQSIAVQATGTNSGGLLFQGYIPASDTHVFIVDESGNVRAHTFTTNLAAATGQKFVTYAPQASEPTIEDFGEAQLTNGSAYVRFDGRFAGTMARGLSYLVFITPEGMTQGTICVTQRTSSGFAVRENQGGRSSVPFAYRIVAKPFGNQAPRLPLLVEHRVPRHLPRLQN
jgi:hypothetical protein